MYSRTLDDSGHAIVRNVFGESAIARLSAAIDERLTSLDKSWKAGKRNMLSFVPDIREMAACPEIRSIIDSILGSRAFAVRAVFFDKTATTNWKIFWHQDSTITVRERRDAPEFVGWSTKEGVLHVVPPAEILADMLAVRIHLDDCGPENGPLRVLSGSHKFGWIPESDLPLWRERTQQVECHVQRGDVVLMRPLLLHASAAAISPARRRVVHIEYAFRELPHGLEWHERVGPTNPQGR